MDTIATNAPKVEETLDPADWETLRVLAHRIVDDAVDYTPVVRARFRSPAPQGERPLAEVYNDLLTNMLPYPMGNIHPRFWMWYMGASNFTGALGDFLAAILGSNLGGGDHAAAEIDKQVVNWLKEILRSIGNIFSGLGVLLQVLAYGVLAAIAAGIIWLVVRACVSESSPTRTVPDG